MNETDGFDRPLPNIDTLISRVRDGSDMHPAMPGQSPLDSAEIMRRVRVETAARKGKNASLNADTDGTGSVVAFPQPKGALARWKSAALTDTSKSEFTLPELLAAADETFVTTAYRALLRREPDAKGASHYLELLRAGVASKVEVLGTLRWSPEGKARSVHVDGLLAPYLLQKLRHMPLIGPVVAWLHALLRLGTFTRRQQVYEASASREAHGLGNLVNELSMQLQSRFEEADAVQARHALKSSEGLASLEALLARRLQELEQANAEAGSHLARIREKQAEAEEAAATRMESLQSQIETLRPISGALGDAQKAIDKLVKQQTATTAQLEVVAGFEDGIRTLREQLQGMQQQQQGMLEQQQGMLEQLRSAALVEQERLAQHARELESARALDPLYAAFEDKFRGSREMVRVRAEPYVAFVQEAGAGTADAPVLDLGCGRGEWLEVLREHGLAGRGVDSNRVFIDLCAGRGLDVIEGDVIEIMRSLPDGSVGAITGMHIAEHLPFEVLIELLDQSRRLLKPGGLLALETPNPENIQVATHYFYMDPTHRNPLPPEAFRWIVEARGFHHVRIERWTIARDLGAPPLLADEIPGAESINALLSQLAVAPDYSIVARRGVA
ncbi:methyltransferase domain-containing protein [Cognatiluteimonas weifangensis]|nr:methyltransferase domain-containing protein [Luteimonas weifangensis]